MVAQHGQDRGQRRPSPLEGISEHIVDDVLVGAILRDVLQLPAEGAPTSRGMRSGLEYDAGLEKLQDLLGDRYQHAPFPEAFRALARGKSVRTVAGLTHLSKDVCHRLMNGKVRPTLEEMECVAKAFRRRPVWFVEYRTALVCSLVARHLDASPERSATIVHRLQL